MHAHTHTHTHTHTHIVDDTEGESEEFIVREGYIQYGSTVKLVCSEMGMALPRLVIRKVDKLTVIVDADDPVSRLHKVGVVTLSSTNIPVCMGKDKIYCCYTVLFLLHCLPWYEARWKCLLCKTA